MENYTTLADAIDRLIAKGYVEDFNLGEQCLECSKRQVSLYPEDFHIDQAIRFDVDADPADQAVLYAISSEKYQLKGLLVNGYGIYTEGISDRLMEKLKY